MGLKLFDDEYPCEDEKLNLIKINEEFARRYEHNKKREDLQRLEELKKKGVVSDDEDSKSEDSSEEEEVDLKSGKKKDLRFFDALIKVRNKDPLLRNKDANLFESDDEYGDSDDETEKGKVKKGGNNVVSKHLIEEGPEFEDSVDNEEYNDKNMEDKKVKSYSEEQEELRKAFLEAVEEAEVGGQDGGELLKEKRKKDADEDDDFGIGNKLDEYFGSDEKLDADSMFLKDYFRNRLWMGDDGDKSGGMDCWKLVMQSLSTSLNFSSTF